MRGDVLDRRPHSPTWFGLGPDVEGICDVCHHRRRLIAQYKPTDAWLCIDCFRYAVSDVEEP